MWFIGVGVEQETIAPPPKKNPESAPVVHCQSVVVLQHLVWLGSAKRQADSGRSAPTCNWPGLRRAVADQ